MIQNSVWRFFHTSRLPGYPVTFKLVGTSEGNAPSSPYRWGKEKSAVFFEVWVFLLVVHEEYSSRSSPRAFGFVLTLPKIIAPWRLGQCRILMLRVRRPVVSRLA